MASSKAVALDEAGRATRRDPSGAALCSAIVLDRTTSFPRPISILAHCYVDWPI